MRKCMHVGKGKEWERKVRRKLNNISDNKKGKWWRRNSKNKIK